jgi:hypothetical protein
MWKRHLQRKVTDVHIEALLRGNGDDVLDT